MSARGADPTTVSWVEPIDCLFLLFLLVIVTLSTAIGVSLEVSLNFAQ